MAHISSTGSTAALKGNLPYAVAKAGLNMETKMFAPELGPHQVRVNSVNPGPVFTDLLKSFVEPGEVEKTESKIPMSRLTEMDEVADLVLFLLSDEAVMISGTSYVIDGGLTCQLP